MQRIEGNQFPMIEDNPENTLQPIPTRRYFTFFSRQAIELLAVGAGVASLGIAIQSQRTISEQNKVIEDLQYRVSNLELDNYKNIYNYPSAAKKSTSSSRAANLLEKLREAKTNIDKIQLLHANKDNIKIFSAAEQNQVMELISGDMVDPVIFSYFSDSSVKAKLASKEAHYRAKNNFF